MSKLAQILRERATAWAAQRASDELDRGDLPSEDELDSGIHMAPAPAPSAHASHAAGGARRRAARASNDTDPRLDAEVTLIVTTWENVQPGAMAWVFPNARQAVAAAKAMRNAVAWSIVRGKRSAESLHGARANGDVLIEQRSRLA